MKTLLIVALGGGFGAVCRWGLVSWVDRISGRGQFPWGILIVNILGCFLFGLLYALGEKNQWFTALTRLHIFTGFLGSFTTFSTFSWDTLQLLKDGQVGPALLNIGISVIVGIAAAWIGYWIGSR